MNLFILFVRRFFTPKVDPPEPKEPVIISIRKYPLPMKAKAKKVTKVPAKKAAPKKVAKKAKKTK